MSVWECRHEHEHDLMKYLKLTISTTILSIVVLLCIFFLSNHNSHAISLKQLLIKSKIPEIKFKEMTKYPHHQTNFTEGIQLDGDAYYESSGLYRVSKLQKIELRSLKVIKEYKLPDQYFAEGLTFLNDKIYQLTYNEKVGFIYDKNTFKLLDTFPINSQGWGLTNDGERLIMSNGTSKLSFINLHNFKVEKTITVSIKKNDIKHLNELDYIHGKIFANVWMSSIILVISPVDGAVIGWLDIESLLPTHCSHMICVANGIFHDDKLNSIYVTGKYWPYIYNILLLNNV